MRHNGFVAFILTHGRPDRVLTYEKLRKHGSRCIAPGRDFHVQIARSIRQRLGAARQIDIPPRTPTKRANNRSVGKPILRRHAKRMCKWCKVASVHGEAMQKHDR